MNIKELRMDMMKSKKTNPDRSKVLLSILNLAQTVAKEDGNREVTDDDITTAAKKELKMTHQSKDAGAPYNHSAFDVCNEFLPTVLDEKETRLAVENAINVLPEKSMKMMGKVMGNLKSTYGDALNGGLASQIVKEELSR